MRINESKGGYLVVILNLPGNTTSMLLQSNGRLYEAIITMFRQSISKFLVNCKSKTDDYRS
jgi:hypothetical protein